MIEPVTGHGVLNDWDLSRVRTKDGVVEHRGGERTGTVPFMALDLLTPEYFMGCKPPLYRHDLEGFIWILPWVFLQFDGSKFTTTQLRWGTGNYEVCRQEKLKMLNLSAFNTYIPFRSWWDEWALAKCLLSWLLLETYQRTYQRTLKDASNQLVERRREFAERRREFGGKEGLLLHPVGESLQGFTPDYKSSPGQDEDDELPPEEVYSRFCDKLMGEGAEIYGSEIS
jgi:hypothetical protein